jgi:hypothetical protein
MYTHFILQINKMSPNLENFEEVKLKGEKFYKSLKDIHCPYFNDKVYFNSQGLEHVKFKGRNKARLEKDQYMRFKLLYLVPEILRASRTLQGIRETNHFERIRVHNRTDTILKPVTYYEFIAVIKRNRLRVIVKQIEDGHKFFWSLVPFWQMNMETMTRVLHDGNPEED